MHKKKLICLAFAALLPMGSVVAEEPAAEQPAVAEAPESAAIQEEAAETAAGTETADKPAYVRMSMEERWKEREKRYEELKKRAEEAGVMLPERPPWHDREAMTQAHPDMQKRLEHMQEMKSMTPEEREAYRTERYQEMRERANEIGMEMPETPPWKRRRNEREEEWLKHQKVIKGMTDEEQAACHAMHRRHMRQAGPGPMMQGGGMYPAMPEGRGPGYGPGPGYGYGPGYGPGYGYGPGPYGPRGNFWDPNQ
ncbi:MAG: hypothetical protein ABFS39_18530 [Pseudomonadota bacterium]